MTRPHLLFVSPRFLFPMDQGGKIRSGNILRAMRGGPFEITLASPAPKDHARYAAEIEQACDHFVSWPEAGPSWIRRAASIASRLPVAVATDRSSAGRAVVRRALAQRPDVVVVDFPHADVLMPRRIDAASIMLTHNVEAEIFERHRSRASGLWRMIWSDQRRKMARFEQARLSRYDTVIAVSGRDRDALVRRYGLPDVEAIDTGVDLDYFAVAPPHAAPDPGPDAGTVVFTATMNWAANVDGIHFVLDEVFPMLRRARPKIRAVIIGRDPPVELAAKIRDRRLNVTLTGFVDDIRPYVAQANVYVIPLFVGSGTRIKVFEAMAMGRPVVSTTVGVEGLDLVEGEHFVRADDARAFASAILGLLDSEAMRVRLATLARQLMEKRYAWSCVARQFESISMQTLERRRFRVGNGV